MYYQSQEENNLMQTVTEKVSHWHMLAIVGVVASIAAIALITPFQNTTKDDTPVLVENLENFKATSRILGASNQTDEYLAGCPEDKPVIGWINLSGEKLIVDSVPEGFLASSCFASFEEAITEGFEPKI